ncbi:MAG: hypothetical protein WC722_09775 [Rhodospirillales bacterium]|jgi:hypothetical protein
MDIQSHALATCDLIGISEFVRNIGLVAVGLVGLGIAYWRSRAANLQAKAALTEAELSRQNHIAEIFNRACGQLSDEKLEVRLGAIYTLERICLDEHFKAYTTPIIETLSACLREKTADSSDGGQNGPLDIQVISETLGQILGKAPENGEGNERGS